MTLLLPDTSGNGNIVKPDICELGITKLFFLGYKLMPEGILLCEENVGAIR